MAVGAGVAVGVGLGVAVGVGVSVTVGVADAVGVGDDAGGAVAVRASACDGEGSGADSIRSGDEQATTSIAAHISKIIRTRTS